MAVERKKSSADWKTPLVIAFSQSEYLTSDVIGKIVGCHGPDAVTRARQAGFKIKVSGHGYRKKRKYILEGNPLDANGVDVSET